ncbi:C-C motif chemokine 3-like [Salminus brasiliensis]|uniref:C-C motif chemokine 3-like n=1 Tax=Salminus brasiliensis TaxID=930266 RepID=UPI003B836ADB
MRGWCGSLLLALLVILYLQSCVEGQNENTNAYAYGPDQCCFSLYPRRIPVKLIEKYEETRSDCSKPGVILTTRRGQSVCVDPNQSWVQRVRDDITQRLVEN